ncbi:uncharacterized protein Z518_01773 [Rhinocladiella mackenziei CBS 650.93]|uniref:Rhinocladiella mackenziei CBS 650.93 unplaced genomic scaffold supercont1.1, whole genome shotgun sequence n=1 Tax=Rhinocladiella mackenziei CBS 650.93 TaxID=1442369 RepID=A0A0D2IXD3_9EURO|nr:uncharacterized protein Z518_01773 [Rhinocladiella mackenziei CBS 650.93]KIX10689.1 hypothetical protein Z518_01773 [Rhinocladiella mackenziei CBS 650.93]
MADRKYEFSRITCVNASREVLTRFITLRTFNAHLDSHHRGTENLLAHQYHSDRTMIEQVQENFRDVNSLNSDALSAHSADLLRRLLAIEADSTHGFSQCAGRVSVHKAGTESVQADLNDEGAVSVHIPYFGIIQITREGLSTIPLEPQSAMGRASQPAQLQAVNMFNENSPRSSHADPQMWAPSFDGPQGAPDAQSMAMVDTGNGHVEAPVMMPEIYTATQVQPSASSMPTSGADYSVTHFAPQHMDDLADPLLRHGKYPGLVAGTEDWAFQGVDLAFFDSLMRTMGNDGNGIADWTIVGEQSMFHEHTRLSGEWPISNCTYCFPPEIWSINSEYLLVSAKSLTILPYTQSSLWSYVYLAPTYPYLIIT